ncbi:MAG: hypothetical protein ABIR17_09600 [Pseudolysinimonas sp.]|uniref:hypothetical protein n=1 Tax=Pseudolysinimonas sp. TaxID=2680009 RepID=UPI00326368DD
MSKLRALTYGVGGGIQRSVPSKLLEWTDGDDIVLHTSHQVGPSGWDVPIGDLKRIGGFTSSLTFTPKDGDAIRVWFADPNYGPMADSIEYDELIARSGITTWVAALRKTGIRSFYVSTKMTYLIAFAVVPAIVVIVGIIVAIAQRVTANG